MTDAPDPSDRRPTPALEEFEVGTYRELDAKSVPNDNLTPDHIPSFAAIKRAEEANLGRSLTPREAIMLRQNMNTVAVRTEIHRAGPTYKGKNTAAQIASDATDLESATNRDTDVLLDNALTVGADLQKVREAIEELHRRNRTHGRY